MNETPPETPPMDAEVPAEPPASLEFTPEPERTRSKRRWQTKALYWALGISVGFYAISQMGIRVALPQATRSARDEKMVATAQLYGGGISSKGILPGWEGWVYPEDIQINFYSPNGPSPLDDAALAKVAEDAGPGPTGLYLNDPRITGAGLKHLGGMTRLEAFTLSGFRRTPAPRGSSDSEVPIPKPAMQIGRGDLAGLTGLPKLALLYVEGAGFSGDAFRDLPSSRSVRNLTLTGSDVPDEALADIPAAFPGLNALNLANTGISDAGLRHLAAMKELSFLTIGSNSGITARGLTSLKALPKLSYLDLTGGRYTPADVAELREARPYLTIDLGSQTLRPATAPR